VEYPHYTRPVEWEGQVVPEVLRNGNHKEIGKWRLSEARNRTVRAKSGS
jgi:tRNA (guanine37-N1)-methyltransferase